MPGLKKSNIIGDPNGFVLFGPSSEDLYYNIEYLYDGGYKQSRFDALLKSIHPLLRSLKETQAQMRKHQGLDFSDFWRDFKRVADGLVFVGSVIDRLQVVIKQLDSYSVRQTADVNQVIDDFTELITIGSAISEKVYLYYDLVEENYLVAETTFNSMSPAAASSNLDKLIQLLDAVSKWVQELFITFAELKDLLK